ncbi:hypothetical protein [Qipengyuania nanhaisediminis]|uniref:Glycosyl transferase family 28 C-terminal domain-containing protein n=1 Tax=Qipengyuania nanhaisediminis TaxID=604088 RepID=A0A1I5PBT7_9SPHN|nr:hypothetical protein [Qipengyuania nanhaisediminis]SFP31443.1 hypothetical protein SAMN04488060_2293 [Qipengyuania nanhaisediminis]
MSLEGPIGYFVHHQGRGHAERAAAIANEVVGSREVTLFCARPDIFPELDDRIEVIALPSLFEPTGKEAPAMAALPMPHTVHCAPLGWPSITSACARLTQWFSNRRPALFVTDVSAELAHLARLCSVPHVAVIQHGERSDAGHMSAYESAVGILAPYAEQLEQSDRPATLRKKTHYAAAVGVESRAFPSKEEARRKLGLDPDRDIVLVIAGGGGEGTPGTPLTLGARAEPTAHWITIGQVRSEWHETPPGNLEHKGWVDNPADWMAAADRVVSSCGNTTAHMVLAAGKPWIVIPEWRYFDEQYCKAEVLDREGLAAVSRQWPSQPAAWDRLWSAASLVDVERQRRAVDPDAARCAALWLEGLAEDLWQGTGSQPALEIVA